MEGGIPYIEDILRFNSEVNRFLQFNRYNNKGVHCTHGLNITGYMIDVCGRDTAAAIEMFF
ncbi:MPPV-091 putative RNA phosphatase [Magpiepox virus 2]|nr:MPPV-091 putative RNA phosphatase [Magpiepox virus 2]